MAGFRWHGAVRARAVVGATVLVGALLANPRGSQDAVAYGDTRSLSFYHMHTKESATITFKRDGRYDSAALDQLNWLLRDWRLDEPTKMDPKLFDVLWQVYRESGSRDAIHVNSAYRSPQTNAMLRRRSRAVSEFSQHMAGKAMDVFLPDVGVDRLRAIGMRLQLGGVGYYPQAFNGFVHIDSGSVRSWPRMSRDQLLALFPSGRTVHLPRDGKPLAGYEEARAEILARGGTVAGATAYAEAGESGRGRSFWARLFGLDDEDSDYYGLRTAGRGRGGAAATAVAAYASGNSDDGGTRGALAFAAPEPTPAPARARRDGRTQLASASADVPLAARAIPPSPAAGMVAAGAEEVASQPAAAAGKPASAEEVTGQVLASVPMPPPRPTEMVVLALAPLPPARPLELAPRTVPAVATAAALAAAAAPAPVPAAAPITTAALAADDRAAIRALFAAAATGPRPSSRAAIASARSRPQPIDETRAMLLPSPALRLGLSDKYMSDLDPNAFTGPAVKPLPLLP